MDKKSFKNTIKDMPLSLPMGVAALGTAASAWLANKRVHALCGMVWLGVSAALQKGKTGCGKGGK